MEERLDKIVDWQNKHEAYDNERFNKIDATLIESRNIREEQHIEIMKMLTPLYKQYAFHLEVSEWTKQKLALIGKVLGVLISAGVVWTAIKTWLIMHVTNIIK